MTRFGGRTSHAAVVARQLGKVCLVGCADLRVDETARACTFGARRFSEGDVVTIDGERGLVYPGSLDVVVDRPKEALAVVRSWRRAPPAPPPLAAPRPAAVLADASSSAPAAAAAGGK